uniref:Uncharacterized protein n=1 Tax=viral metagenome TaxID=1070528 RepID=A0A6C0IIN7_9ZZZZ
MNPMDVKHCCEKHQIHSTNAISPCRGICSMCKKKRVHGYENPDHVSNPFGYLYLIPSICLDCSTKTKQCMWCPDT